MRRYSAVALFSPNLDRVVLIHKLRPTWQAGKANFPGGKVEKGDWPLGVVFDLPSKCMSQADEVAGLSPHLVEMSL